MDAEKLIAPVITAAQNLHICGAGLHAGSHCDRRVAALHHAALLAVAEARVRGMTAVYDELGNASKHATIHDAAMAVTQMLNEADAELAALRAKEDG